MDATTQLLQIFAAIFIAGIGLVVLWFLFKQLRKLRTDQLVGLGLIIGGIVTVLFTLVKIFADAQAESDRQKQAISRVAHHKAEEERKRQEAITRASRENYQKQRAFQEQERQNTYQIPSTPYKSTDTLNTVERLGIAEISAKNQEARDRGEHPSY